MICSRSQARAIVVTAVVVLGVSSVLSSADAQSGPRRIERVWAAAACASASGVSPPAGVNGGNGT